MKKTNNLKGESIMKKDKYGIELKVGDYVFLDSFTGQPYGTSASKIVQIKKLGSKRISFDAGFTNLRTAHYENLTAYTLVGYKVVNNLTWNTVEHFPLFTRTATNDEVYKARINNFKNINNKDYSSSMIKQEQYRYENKEWEYTLRNKPTSFSTDIVGMRGNKPNSDFIVIETETRGERA
jgi:hypothetical protein